MCRKLFDVHVGEPRNGSGRQLKDDTTGCNLAASRAKDVIPDEGAAAGDVTRGGCLPLEKGSMHRRRRGRGPAIGPYHAPCQFPRRRVSDIGEVFSRVLLNGRIQLDGAIGRSLEPSLRSLEPSGSSLEPSGRSLEPSGRSLEPSGRSLEPSLSWEEPSGRSLEPSGRSLEPSPGF